MKKYCKNLEEKKESLLKAVLEIKTNDEASRFFTDLCSPAELEAMSDRWQVAKMLDDGLPYRKIAEETGVSVTTVTRVARCLNEKNSGYKTIMERIEK